MKPILNIENLTKIYGNVPSQTNALNGRFYLRSVWQKMQRKTVRSSCLDMRYLELSG